MQYKSALRVCSCSLVKLIDSLYFCAGVGCSVAVVRGASHKHNTTDTNPDPGGVSDEPA